MATLSEKAVVYRKELERLTKAFEALKRDEEAVNSSSVVIGVSSDLLLFRRGFELRRAVLHDQFQQFEQLGKELAESLDSTIRDEGIKQMDTADPELLARLLDDCRRQNQTQTLTIRCMEEEREILRQEVSRLRAALRYATFDLQPVDNNQKTTRLLIGQATTTASLPSIPKVLMKAFQTS